MKKQILLAFTMALFMLPVFGQTQPKIQLDSSWISNQNGRFFQNRVQVYEGGEQNISVVPLGDTTRAMNRYKDEFLVTARRFSFDAGILREQRREITEIIRYGNALKSVLGRSPIDSIRAAQTDLTAQTGWTVAQANVEKGLRFRVTAAGLLQYRHDTITTWRPADFLGDIIRLNKLNGYTTDFYNSGPKKWVSIDGRYTITAPGNSQARSVIFPEDVEEKPTAPVPSAPIFNADGTVTFDGKKHTYNRTSKKWASK